MKGRREMMPPGFQEFIDECRADAKMPADVLDQMDDVARLVVDECSEHPDAVEFLDALTWIFTHRDRTIVERLDAVLKLTSLKKGKVTVNMHTLTGW
jgi:hypothetical protein